MLSRGGFNLTTFVVNDSQLLDDIEECHRAEEIKQNRGPESSGNILGVKWVIMADVFTFAVRAEIDQ